MHLVKTAFPVQMLHLCSQLLNVVKHEQFASRPSQQS